MTELQATLQQRSAELDSAKAESRAVNEKLHTLQGEAAALQQWQQTVQSERAAEAEAVKQAKQVTHSALHAELRDSVFLYTQLALNAHLVGMEGDAYSIISTYAYAAFTSKARLFAAILCTGLQVQLGPMSVCLQYHCASC